MLRTLVSVALLFVALFGGFYLLRSDRTEIVPTVIAPEASSPSDSDELPEQVREARAQAPTKMSLWLGGEECDCCGLDGLPPEGMPLPPGHILPLDHLGRLWVRSNLEGVEIPQPQNPEGEFKSLFRLVSGEEPEDEDNNEPKEGDVLPKTTTKPVDLVPVPLDPATASEETKIEPAPAAETTTESAPSKAVEPTAPPRKLTPELVALRDKVRMCLSHYYFQRQESTAGRSPWGLMHCLIAYGVDTRIIHDNKRVNAIGWLSYNGMGKGQNLFYLDRQGKLQARIGVGVQGHAGQYLAMLAQSRVKADFPLLVEGKKFTVADLIEYEKFTCKANTELTFKLIAFAYYLPSDATWKNEQGEDWDISRVIREELKQPIVGAACGGTHRLMGLSYAVKKREQRGEPMDGQYLRAKKFVEGYEQYLMRLQNPDGSFSTDWFVGRADNGKPTRKLETTSHMLEWLVYNLPEERLTDPRVVRCVDFLANLLLSDPYGAWAIGPQGHGLHALALYDERVFGGKPGERATQLAKDFKQLRR